jgi:exoribonuclease R|uniref:RNB domain-containing protein n=1 Tax=viral metagenome TaxID=1070528 RepID=A0A6C0DXM6_9ZZZZ
MKTYVIQIHSSDYSSWEIYDNSLGEPYTNIAGSVDIDPVKCRLFSRDTFFYEADVFTLDRSSIRAGETIAGVLILEQNKTFGRTKNKKRLLYRCIPNNRELPAFLVPYDPSVSFSKIQKNKYVTFVFDQWENTHPQGLLTNVIGDVDVLENYYEYQMFSKGLHTSMKDFTEKVRDAFRNTSVEAWVEKMREKYTLEDRTHRRDIFSIDGENCQDIDDAVSIRETGENIYTVSVYIANVALWIEALGAWPLFTDRVSTIYLPHQKYGMLPNLLSDDICSLREGRDRVAFATDIVISATDGCILSTSFHNVLIRVSKNYVYEEPSLRDNPVYTRMYELTRKISDINTSAELISFWMVKTNTVCGEHMKMNEVGIFRATEKNENIHAHAAIQQEWAGYSGKYVLYSTDVVHEVMKITHYIHITSPIRRLVDFLNQIAFVRLYLALSTESFNYLENWKSKMDSLNDSMRKIKKGQNESWLLYHFYKDPNIIGRNHYGRIVDKKMSGGIFKYSVYLAEYRLFTSFKTNEILEPSCVISFRLYLFESEHEVKRKVRIEMS